MPVISYVYLAPARTFIVAKIIKDKTSETRNQLFYEKRKTSVLYFKCYSLFLTSARPQVRHFASNELQAPPVSDFAVR
ncbi:MAG: hypothetical protein CSA31_01295 [Desulfobulbus propionicus]|nr:MAG: hypothetical protein CSA31_01295 [Desulfobulbus propionicus]